MNLFIQSIKTETLKLRKSGFSKVIILLFLFLPCMLGLLMYVQLHPEEASRLGMMSGKANMLEGKNWSAYFSFLKQVFAGLGLIGTGVSMAWIFGREFADNTAKDLLALPVSRREIVFSKLLVGLTFGILLSLLFLISAITIGLLMHIPGWQSDYVIKELIIFCKMMLMTLILTPVAAYFATKGRGYLLAFGFVVLTLILANLVAFIGIGQYFPWAIPGLFGAGPGGEGYEINSASYVILFATGIIGLLATLKSWMYSDHK
ncbi:MAG: ABC transporter permease subunit [Bacteroidetes bacterium]|nr:ABC transporter permease subunit [Bacteroidota bacterium]